MIEFDVVIIGGGLSGSSTALNLSKKGYSVLIIEKEKFQDYKPCAGGMASSMQKFLPLNIEDCIESKIKNVEFRWKAADNVTADLTGESPFWIVKREKLDLLLLNESLSNVSKTANKFIYNYAIYGKYKVKRFDKNIGQELL